MSQSGKPQAPASRSRPAGGRGSQLPASAMEDSGVRRTTRSRSNTAPAPPESSVKKKTQKLDVHDGAGESGPSGAGAMKRSAHRGKADHAGGGWAVQGPRESLSTYASRVQSHLCEYEEATKTIRRLREELRCARARANTAPKKRKMEINGEINRLKAEIDKLTKRKTFICENSGPFKEKLINDDRFAQMADNREQRLMGLQPVSQVEEEDDDDDNEQQFPPGGLQEDQQASCSGPPAGQPAVTPRSGEDSDTGSQGGALMAEIRLLESPVRMENFSFADELPEEAAGGSSRRKSKKTRPKQQEERKCRVVMTTLSQCQDNASDSWDRRRVGILTRNYTEPDGY
ncbi:uncharacterized protein [Engystomops pustulosus]|uniref:uncharacterized protein isoform X2 n=1 Tax=Engystomops pustulosus TaxID=76066 RepID=UPI003AFA4AF9